MNTLPDSSSCWRHLAERQQVLREQAMRCNEDLYSVNNPAPPAGCTGGCGQGRLPCDCALSYMDMDYESECGEVLAPGIRLLASIAAVAALAAAVLLIYPH